MNRISDKLVIFVCSLVLTGCVSSANTTRSSFSPQCQSTAKAPSYYIAAAATNRAEQQLTQQVLYNLARRDGIQTIVDRISSDRLDNLYSNQHNRRTIQQIGKNWTIAPTTNQGTVAAIQRLHTLTADRNSSIALKAYIVTSGTVDPIALQQMQTATSQLSDRYCLQVNIIGLSSSHRLKMAEAMKSIADRLRFAGTNPQEWHQLVD